MSGCTPTGKPPIAILLAVYEPRLDWLREQLESLEKQTYPNLKLYVRDDCSRRVPFEEIERCVRDCIRSFPYEIRRNGENLGSNRTFERLTEEAQGDFFAYCDQDDVWHSDKIQKMVETLEKTGSPLVCCDLNIIDGRGRQIASSITKIRKRHIFREGNGLAGQLLVSNFISGCAMMMNSDIAKRSVPFVDSLVHDQWLSIHAALCGRIEVIREALIDYRQHGDNQTGILHGVSTKSAYYQSRIQNMKERISEYKIRLCHYDEVRPVIADLEEFNEARSRYFYHHRLCDLKIMRSHKEFLPQAVMLETVMPFLPDRLMKIIFKMIKLGLV